MFTDLNPHNADTLPSDGRMAYCLAPVRAVPPLRLPPQAPALGCGSQTTRLDRGRDV